MNDSRQQLRKSISEIVRPIVGFLLEAGIGFREFSQIAKTEFVRLASKSYGVRGRPTNISRVAVMTGLTRKEIKSIREASEEQGPDSALDMERVNPGTVLLHAWFSDPAFLGEDGEPLPLTPSGESHSFEGLCKKYGGDIPAGAMLSELRRAGSVRENRNGQIEPVSRYYTPTVFDERFVASMAFSLGNLARTLMKNASYSRRGEAKQLKDLGLLERYVWTSRLSSEDAAEFKKVAEEKATELLAELDKWIGAREKPGETHVANSRSSRPDVDDVVGLGIYIFERKSDTDSEVG